MSEKNGVAVVGNWRKGGAYWHREIFTAFVILVKMAKIMSLNKSQNTCKF